MSLDVKAVVYCDHPECKNHEEVHLTETVTSYPSWDARNVARTMKVYGWDVVSSGGMSVSYEFFCPEHVNYDAQMEEAGS